MIADCGMKLGIICVHHLLLSLLMFAFSCISDSPYSEGKQARGNGLAGNR